MRLKLLATFVLAPLTAAAGEFDGWCFPTNVCIGFPSPIRNNSFDTCEQTCHLEQVSTTSFPRGIVYDVLCRGDTSCSTNRATIFSIGEEDRRVFYSSGDGVTELQPCEGH